MTAGEFAVLAAPLLLSVMLIPAVLELRKPRDAGPRFITPQVVQVYQAAKMKAQPLSDIEEKDELDASLKP